MSSLKRVKFLNSIQVTLALAISLIVVAILGSMGWLLYSATDAVVEENTVDTTEKMIRQVNYDIKYYLDAVETTMESIRYSEAVADYFREPSELNRVRVITYLDSLMINRDDIINIALIRPDGTMITNDLHGIIKKDVDFTGESYYEEAMDKDGMQVSSSHVQNILLGQYQWVVSCSSGFRLRGSDSKDGVILVDLNFNLIEDMVSRISIGEKGYIFIMDDAGRFVYHPKRELIYSGLRTEAIGPILEREGGSIGQMVDGSLVDYIITEVPYTDWLVIGKSYEEDINPYQQTLNSYFITMVFTAIIIAVILSVLLAETILRPVRRLLEGIGIFQDGQLEVEVPVELENELGLLTSAFNRMTKRIKKLVEENRQSEINKRKSELEALQAQINPHFLYNTLDSIVWMGETGKSDEVVKMTSSLAKLFRISISKGREYISLKQEIEHVESYLIIQQMRYGDKLSYSIDVDGSLYREQIIKILLQPIVENAIYHGIKQLPGNGEVQIRVKRAQYRDRPHMVIEIEDDGMGMDEATINKLMQGDSSMNTRGSGLGVHNVDQRIKLYYGDDYGLDITSELYEGTLVTIRLPLNGGMQHEEV